MNLEPENSESDWVGRANEIAARIRRRGFEYVLHHNGGYLSQICSSAEIFSWLYCRGMRLGESTAPMIPVPFKSVPGRGQTRLSGAAYNGPASPELDRFIFSPGHYALVLYVTLIEVGRMAPEGLKDFNQDGSTVELISAEHSPGAEVTSGSLSQALSVAAGIAMGRRLKGHSGTTWVMMSDGEFQEGQTWEAVQTLAHYRLNQVKVIVDVNGQQCDGPMDSVMPIEPLAEKLNAFGAYAVDVDGHDVESFDRLAMSIAYPNLPVRTMGFLPGIVTPGGVTHQAIEDIAIMRATPNMTIFDTGDATDVESVLDVAHAVDGPVFVRMLRGDLPRLFPANEPMIFNRARVLSQGDDVSILSSSVATEEALRAVAALKAKAVSVHHLHVSTLKPFSDPVVLDAIARSRCGVITMENHSIIGGLGSAVAELMAESAAAKPLLRLGLDDTYAHGATKHYLMKEYGLDASRMIKAVEQLLHVSLDIDEDQLGEVYSGEDSASSKVEAL